MVVMISTVLHPSSPKHKSLETKVGDMDRKFDPKFTAVIQ